MPKRRLIRNQGREIGTNASPLPESMSSNDDGKEETSSTAISKIASSPKLVSSESTSIMNTSSRPLHRLGIAFFDQPCIDLAKSLLGKVLVRKLTRPNSATSVVLAARIVETESYLGSEDRASHSFNNRRTDRNAAMFMSPGTCYVYLTYGMYECFNISSRGDGAAVLIRSAEPLTGIEYMRELRGRFQRSKKRKLDCLDTVDPAQPRLTKLFKLTDICSGPSKLCMAMAITKQEFNRADLIQCDRFYIADDGYGAVQEVDIVNCPRIGINNAGEWNTKPLRFYIKSSNYVSVKVKQEK